MSDGTVRDSSRSIDDPAMLDPSQFANAREGHVVVIPASRIQPGEDGTLRVVATQATEGSNAEWVLVASPTGTVDDSTEAVQSVLLVAYPLLLAALAAFTYRLVGWALRPVESLRQGAAMISASGRQVGRLPVPDGKDEVNRLAETLNDMLDRLDAARARQQAFVADAAHELRSPIASLRTQLEVAQRLDEAPLADDLMADVARLGRLVDDLLLLARADEGDPQLRLVEAVDLGELTADVAHGYAKARVPVTCAADSNALTLGDPVALRRVVDEELAGVDQLVDERVAQRAPPRRRAQIGDDLLVRARRGGQADPLGVLAQRCDRRARRPAGAPAPPGARRGRGWSSRHTAWARPGRRAAGGRKGARAFSVRKALTS